MIKRAVILVLGALLTIIFLSYIYVVTHGGMILVTIGCRSETIVVSEYLPSYSSNRYSPHFFHFAGRTFAYFWIVNEGSPEIYYDGSARGILKKRTGYIVAGDFQWLGASCT
jgi:hypothetical protein